MTTANIQNIYAQATRWAFPFVLLLLALSVYTCNNEQDQRADLAERLDALESRTIQIESQNGKLVAQNDQLLTRNSQEIKTLTDTIFDLKAKEERLIKQVTSYTRIIQDIRFKDKEAVYIEHDTVFDRTVVYLPQPQDTDLIRVPRRFGYEDSTIKFEGWVTKRNVKVDSLSIPNTLHLREVTQKTGFLKLGRKRVVQAVNSNPAIVNTGISSVTLEVRPNWWHRWGKPAAVAIVTGFIVHRIGSQ